MAENKSNNGNLNHLGDRKDARKKLMGTEPTVAECRTMDATFKATVQVPGG